MLEILLNKLEVFFLIFARVSTILVVFPVFGYRGTPPPLKIGLAFLLAVLLLPVVGTPASAGSENLLSYFVALLGEVSAGLLVGFVASLLFMGVYFMGQLVGIQMGFNIVEVIDPQSEAQVSLLGQFHYLLAVLIFLTIDGHHFLIQALGKSFEAIPLLGVDFSRPLALKLIRLTGGVFEAGAKIAAPVLVTLMLTTVALGILARLLPQMNLFAVGFPLQIAVGLATMALGLPLFLYVFQKLYAQFQQDLVAIIALLGGH